MKILHFDTVRLEEDSSFDCGDVDLNDFLLNDAKNYLLLFCNGRAL